MEEEAAEGDEQGEEPKIVAKKRPEKPPSREEVDKHLATHYPYRAWCRACVAGAGRRDAHKSKGERLSEIPVICMDDFFFNDCRGVGETEETEEQECQPILLVVDTWTRGVFSEVVPKKGMNEHSIRVVVEAIKWMGHEEIKIRTDGERSIVALANEIAKRLKELGIRVVLDLTPKRTRNLGVYKNHGCIL